MSRNPRPDARALAVEVLCRVERDEAFSHVALDAALDAETLDPRDRALATHIVYGTLAMQRRLDTELATSLEGPLHKRTKLFERNVLRAALYQIRHLDRVPAHAAVNSAVGLVRSKRGKGAAGFVNAILRRILRGQDEVRTPTDPVAAFGLEFSLPDEIARRALTRFGDEEARRWAAALNQPPPLCLRAGHRTARTHDDLTALADRLGTTVAPWAPWALRTETTSPALAEALRTGEVVVQDEGAQLLVHWTGALHGRIWDACAGQGGKAIQILDLLVRRGQPATLVATDVHAAKLDRLREAARRHLGEPAAIEPGALPHGERWRYDGDIVLETGLVDASRPVDALGVFDVVIVDAPCSGFGLMRRHPETRWRRDDGSIDALVTLQRQILEGAASRVAPSGALLYAVCTDTDEESRDQVAGFLERHAGTFSLEAAPQPAELAETLGADGACLTLTPHRHGTDGFFAARFVRATEAP